MLLLALVLAAAPAAPGQRLAGPAFEAFAAATDARCPARGLRFTTPGDLDLLQEDFVASLPRATRARLAAANHADARCAGHDGLACPTTATLDALARTRLLARFTAFACRAPASGGATSGYSPAAGRRPRRAA